MFPGETIHTGASDTCEGCNVKVKLKVMHSGAGYYIGTECDCGPYTRESDYYKTHAQAAAALMNNSVKWRE